ncbi:hypothetical protein VTI74DRAFT_3379 [Chaetomium olivicolor]
MAEGVRHKHMYISDGRHSSGHVVPVQHQTARQTNHQNLERSLLLLCNSINTCSPQPPTPTPILSLNTTINIITAPPTTSAHQTSSFKMSSQQTYGTVPTPRSYGQKIAASTRALQQQSASTTTTITQQREADTASVASTFSLSSRVTLLKDKLHISSSSSQKSKEQQAREAQRKKDLLRSQIRIGI